jgi:hypothetical protein
MVEGYWITHNIGCFERHLKADKRLLASSISILCSRVVNQLIDYQVIAILIDYFNYQFN